MPTSVPKSMPPTLAPGRVWKKIAPSLALFPYIEDDGPCTASIES